MPIFTIDGELELDEHLALVGRKPKLVGIGGRIGDVLGTEIGMVRSPGLAARLMHETPQYQDFRF